jgi:hypothetical protein
VDRREAASVAQAIVSELREVPYEQLIDRFLDEIETREVAAPSGTEYQAEIHAFWDMPGVQTNLRVIVGVDDGSFRGAFSPVARSFVVAPDGSIVGDS